MPLSESELSLLDGVSQNPTLEESMDQATRRDPDEHAQSLNLPVSGEVYTKNKGEFDRQQRLTDMDVPGIKEHYPKTSEWLSDPDNAAVASDDLDVLKGLEESLREPERGFWNNAARGGLGTINNLTGNLLEFAGNAADNFEDYMVNTVGMPNPGIIISDDGISWSGNIPTEKTDAGFLGRAISEGDAYGYEPQFTWENLKGEVTPTNLAGYIVEQGIQSIPHMLATIYTLPAYIASRTEDIAETRVANDDRETVTSQDLAASFVPATIVALMERIGAKATLDIGGVTGAKGVAKAIGTAAGKEGATEFVQEGIEYVGETAFTKKDLSAAEMIDRQFAGLVAGAGMGAGIRATTATIEAVSNKTSRQVITTAQSVSEQQQIDEIIQYAQSSTTNARAKDRFDGFINSLGEEREVLIPTEIAAQMENAPEYILSQLNDLGTSVTIPLSKFATDIAPVQEWIDLARPHLKMSENTLNQQEMESDQRGEIDSLLKKAQQHKETFTEAEKVFEEVKSKIVATERQPEVFAKYSAQIYPAMATVMAEKARKAGNDVSVKDVFEMMGFQVESDIKPRAPEDAVAIVNQADIPVDLEITMDVQTIETGETTQEPFNAKELMGEIDGNIDVYSRLRDCLG